MKIVLAMDSFKGTLHAHDACRIISEAIHAVLPSAEVILKPMADGGEGTADALMEARGGEWVAREVMGPLPSMKIKAGYAWFEKDRTALVEMASASGLPLLRADEYNPCLTTTFGTGELIRACLERAPRRILLAVGGSATVDGGVGAAMALGWKFLDGAGAEIPLGGEGLSKVAKVVPPTDLHLPEVDVLCDVDNPLLGEYGAAPIYGPQKGASPEMVECLSAGLEVVSRLVREQTGIEMDIPGGGAAGGLSAGAVAFMGAKLIPGIDTVMEFSGLKDALSGADWVVTGEGKFDSQSLRGKVVSGVIRAAKQAGSRVCVIAGTIQLSDKAIKEAGIEAAFATRPDTMPLDDALAEAESLLAEATGKFLTWSHL
ncbi:MAG: glycerate kinase [Verrucomicrobia bacterium]|nr:glycerate kinase [Verrucomicrobiota bacterium]